MILNLVKIPACLLQDRVIPLLEIVDLVRLDSAVLNLNERTLFHEQLRGAHLITESLKVDKRTAQWMLNRKFRISALHVSRKETDLSSVKQLAASGGSTKVSLGNGDMVPSEAVIDFIHACKNVKYISLNDFCSGDCILESMAQSCVALRTIQISGGIWNISIQTLTALTISCKLLSEISLTTCGGWFTDASANVIAVNCPQLQIFNINYCYMCGDATALALAQHCPDLRYLGFNGLRLLSERGLAYLAACAELRAVLLFDNLRVTPNGIITLAQGCTKLEEIHIPNCNAFLHQAVEALVQHCPALNTLRCSSGHFTDKSLQHLQNCPLLHTLEIKNEFIKISAAALVSLFASCLSLRHFKMFFSAPISEVPNGHAIPEENTTSSSSSSLVSLSFAYCSDLTDAAFIPLIAMCPEIIQLNLHGSTQLTDAAVLAVAAHCRQLQQINLGSCSGVSDDAVCVLAESCPELRTLNFSHCNLIAKAAVSALAQHCRYIQHIKLSYCTMITDDLIIEILQKCRQLRELQLFHCTEITSKVLDAAALYGACLRDIDLGGCVKVGADAVAAFRTAKPNCKLVVV